MPDETQFVERIGRVLRCTVSTAAKGSSLNDRALQQTAAAIADLPQNQDIGAILLVGTGPNFCTGGDVKGFAAAEDPSAHVGAVARAFHTFIRALTEAPVPVVAAVHGWAAGAGMSIACAADLVIGGAGSKFRPAYPAIGFSPDGGMSWTLPRLVGAGRARSILLNNTVLSGSDAYGLGLVSELVDDALVAERALELATTLADGPTGAYDAIKTLLRDGQQRGLVEHLDAEADSISARAASAEGREGVRAFSERRPPQFHA